MSLLLGRTAHANRIAAEKSRQHARCYAQIDAGHGLADAVDIESAAAHAAIFLGNEQQLDADRLAAQVLDQFDRECLIRVEIQEQLFRKGVGGEPLNSLECH